MGRWVAGHTASHWMGHKPRNALTSKLCYLPTSMLFLECVAWCFSLDGSSCSENTEIKLPVDFQSTCLVCLQSLSAWVHLQVWHWDFQMRRGEAGEMLSALLTTAFCLHVPHITTFVSGLVGMEFPFIMAAHMELCLYLQPNQCW